MLKVSESHALPETVDGRVRFGVERDRGRCELVRCGCDRMRVKCERVRVGSELLYCTVLYCTVPDCTVL